jgi:hypothetical protein
MYKRYHTSVPVVSDQLVLSDGRAATLPPRSSFWLVVVDIDCDDQGRAAAATTTDIKRVSLVRARDLAPERPAGYDLTDQLVGGEPPEIPWP